MLKEFKEFALKGNMLDMATGIVIGAAVGTVVNSLVNDVLMPPVGLLLGGVDFSNWFLVIKEGATAAPYSIVEAAAEAGAVTVNWGLCINNLISFLVVSFVKYLLKRAQNQLRRAEEDAPTRHREVKKYRERSEIF